MAGAGGSALGPRRSRRHQADRGAAVGVGPGPRVDGAKPVGRERGGRAHHVLSSILADAVRDHLLAANPAAGVKLPRKNRKRPVYLTHQQVAELAAASGTYEGLVLLMAYTGLRWGEAIGLRVRDLDMLRRRATVSENAVQVG